MGPGPTAGFRPLVAALDGGRCIGQCAGATGAGQVAASLCAALRPQPARSSGRLQAHVLRPKPVCAGQGDFGHAGGDRCGHDLLPGAARQPAAAAICFAACGGGPTVGCVEQRSAVVGGRGVGHCRDRRQLSMEHIPQGDADVVAGPEGRDQGERRLTRDPGQGAVIATRSLAAPDDVGGRKSRRGGRQPDPLRGGAAL